MTYETLRASVLVWFAILVALLVGSCGGPPREAFVALEAAGEAYNLADDIAAREVERAGEAHRAAILADEAITTIEAALAEFDRRMEPFHVVDRTLSAVRQGLFTLEAALRAWQAGEGSGDFFATVPCLFAAFVHLGDALTAAGVEVPEQVDTVLRALNAFGGACR